MAVRPEVLAQLARMLGDDALRSATDAQVEEAVRAHFEVLVDALVAETAASDDVYDRDSALRYAELRLDSLGGVLRPETVDRLRSSVSGKIATW